MVRLLGEFVVSSLPREELRPRGIAPGPDDYPKNSSDDN